MQLANVLYAGFTLDFRTSVPDFPASAGWTLKYLLAPRAIGGATIELVATADGDGYRVQRTAAQTAAWVAGAYTYEAYVDNVGGERYPLARGQCEIVAALGAGQDTRSHIEKVLAAIEAQIEGRTDVQEYSIGNRSIKKMDVSELMRWRNIYRQELRSVQAADRIAAGLQGRKVQVVLR